MTSYGILSFLKKYPTEIIKELTCNPECISADLQLKLYEFQFTNNDSTKALEQVAYQWRQFFDLLEAKAYEDFHLKSTSTLYYKV